MTDEKLAGIAFKNSEPMSVPGRISHITKPELMPSCLIPQSQENLKSHNSSSFIKKEA